MDAIQTYYLRNLGIVVYLANPKIVEIPFLFHLSLVFQMLRKNIKSVKVYETLKCKLQRNRKQGDTTKTYHNVLITSSIYKFPSYYKGII